MTTLTQCLEHIEYARRERGDVGDIVDRLCAPARSKVVHLEHIRDGRARAARLIRLLEMVAAHAMAERGSAKGSGREGGL